MLLYATYSNRIQHSETKPLLVLIMPMQITLGKYFLLFKFVLPLLKYHEV